MTNSGISNTGEGSVRSGLCSAPQRPERWLQQPTIPASCFAISAVVHQIPGGDLWCYAIEASDPHTKELLGMIVEPTRKSLTAAHLASVVATDIRATILALTDPEPF